MVLVIKNNFCFKIIKFRLLNFTNKYFVLIMQLCDYSNSSYIKFAKTESYVRAEQMAS